MLVVETVVRLRREYAAGKPIKAVCRGFRLSRKVVRKAIRAEEGAFSYQRTTQPFPKIGPVRDRLVQLLTENEARPRRDRLRLTRVWDLLVQEGYDGSYDSVRRYAARWREETKTAPGDGGTAFVPLMFAPGEAFQFDFSHEDVEVAGQPMRVFDNDGQVVMRFDGLEFTQAVFPDLTGEALTQRVEATLKNYPVEDQAWRGPGAMRRGWLATYIDRHRKGR